MTVAEGIIVHAETLCEREDHLWDVIKKLSIPVSELEDARDQNRVTYGTDEMFRALLFMGVRGISQNKLAAIVGVRSNCLLLGQRVGRERCRSPLLTRRVSRRTGC